MGIEAKIQLNAINFTPFLISFPKKKKKKNNKKAQKRKEKKKEKRNSWQSADICLN